MKMVKTLKHVTVGTQLTQAEYETDASHDWPHGTSFPGSPSERDLFWRDDLNKGYVYDGSDWVDVTNVDHGALSGLGDDDHSQYHTDARGDARYFQKTEFKDASAGAGDAGKPVKLNSDGKIDPTMLKTRTIYKPAHGMNTDGTEAGIYGHSVVTFVDNIIRKVVFEFYVPDDFASLLEAVVSVQGYANASGNIYVVSEGSWGAAGESCWATEDEIPYAAVAIAQNVIVEIDVSDAFDGIAPGDYVGLRFQRDGAHASDTLDNSLYVFGLKFKYAQN